MREAALHGPDFAGSRTPVYNRRIQGRLKFEWLVCSRPMQGLVIARGSPLTNSWVFGLSQMSPVG